MMMYAYSHQQRIRQLQKQQNPHKSMSIQELRSGIVKPVTRSQAWTLIEKYEYLGTMPQFTAGYGLYVKEELVGVSVFVLAGGYVTYLFQELRPYLIKAACLARGACVQWAHKNAASFLISRACKQACTDFGWRVFFAYGDPNAGECGYVYQACNWLYLGQGVGRENRNRPLWIHTKDGVETKYYTKSLRNRLKKRLFPFDGDLCNAKNISVLHQNSDWRRVLDDNKHKYVHFEGTHKERTTALQLLRYPIKAYPKYGEMD